MGKFRTLHRAIEVCAIVWALAMGTVSRDVHLTVTAYDTPVQTVWRRQALSERDIRLGSRLGGFVASGRNVLQSQKDVDIISAAQAGTFEAVLELLGEHANIEAKNAAGGTPLIEASFAGHMDIVQLLLAAGANVTYQDNEGFSALHTAAQEGHLIIVRDLINKGAEIDQRTNKGSTPLILAAQDGHSPVVELLIERKANVGVRDNAGATALYKAAQDGHLEVVKALLAGRADVDARYLKNKVTPLIVASQEAHLSVVRELLARGAHVNAQDDVQVAAIHVASVNSRTTAMIRTLINAGADVNIRDAVGHSPLHWAARFGNVPMLKVLMKSRVEKSLKTRDGKLAQDIICDCQEATIDSDSLVCAPGRCSTERMAKINEIFRKAEEDGGLDTNDRQNETSEKQINSKKSRE